MSSIAAIHIGKKDLGLDDDTYRALLARVTGKNSAKDMTEAQRQDVLREMRRQGFTRLHRADKAASKQPRKVLTGTYAKKAQALWIALWNLGAVESPHDSALIAFFERQTGIARPEWVIDAADGRAVVEALKSWCEREGVNWSAAGRQDFETRHGYQIARAQHARLNDEGKRDFWTEVAFCIERSTISRKPEDREWIAVMNWFGKRIRAAKKAAQVAA